ncbi:hypothetical protein GFY24_24940 [Nocardia sp. SYP-A9097]|uniref:hypothetical protein n=1 Tax=Nocardia sp. SYP-A9097 TaxID=2663237 RepID=UPI00129AF0C3|nr:hypothetical protein [Nocardia sp. SYP-A9097]MRH90648.1 hypothetical protein [Nocardia sp. SYP-A9097]
MTDEPGATPQTRLYEFPGGLFELQSAADESDDYSGFHLEFSGRGALIGPHDEGLVMKYKPTAVGYLRTDVSGVAQLWDQSQVRREALLSMLEV